MWTITRKKASLLIKSLDSQRVPKTKRLIYWQPPKWSFFKLNTDEALKRSGLANAGGLVRNYCREWVCGFSMNLGSCSIMEAELWGLYQSLLTLISTYRSLILFRANLILFLRVSIYSLLYSNIIVFPHGSGIFIKYWSL